MVFLSEVGQRGTTPDIIPFPANGKAGKLNKVLSPIFISLHQIVHADGSAAGPFSRWKLPVRVCASALQSAASARSRDWPTEEIYDSFFQIG